MRDRTHAIGLALVAAASLGLAAARAGETAERKDSHSLRGMLTPFSWQAKRRPWYQHVLWYLPSRGADLLDCFGLEVGGGIGIHANVHLTRYLQLGMGRELSSRAGLMSRYLVTVDCELDEKALGWYWRFNLKRDTLLGGAADIDIGEDEALAGYYKEADPAGIGVAAFPGAFGLSAELKLHEVLDLVLGILTIDSLDDDY